MVRLILSGLVKKHDDIELLGEFDNALDGLNFIKKNKVDLIFLDLEMPTMSGMEFLQIYHKQLPDVIITTSHVDFAIEAFQYNVSGYLVKPIDTVSFNKAILKLQENKTSLPDLNIKNDNLIFVKKGTTIKKVNKKDIVLIECIGDYVNLFTLTDKHTLHSTMKFMETKFTEPEYIRVHRSYIVRLDIIEEIEDDAISFGKKLIPIGKTYKQTVLSKLNML
jgi:DNA-binding LytR/AlgR family response regulator